MAQYLVCYDVADPKRLGRVRRRIVKHAIFVQLSVYYMQGDRVSLSALLDELKEVIDENHDDVRAYAVKPLSSSTQIGRMWLPDEIGIYE